MGRDALLCWLKTGTHHQVAFGFTVSWSEKAIDDCPRDLIYFVFRLRWRCGRTQPSWVVYYCGRRKPRHNLPEAYVVVTWLVNEDKRDVWFPQICQRFCPKSVSGQGAVPWNMVSHINTLYFCPRPVISVCCSALRLQLELTSFVSAHISVQPTQSWYCKSKWFGFCLIKPVQSHWLTWCYSVETGKNSQMQLPCQHFNQVLENSPSYRQDILTKDKFTERNLCFPHACVDGAFHIMMTFWSLSVLHGSVPSESAIHGSVNGKLQE